MRYHIKTFKSWTNESKTNEGVLDFIKSMSKKFIDFLSKFPGLIWERNKFEGTGSWILNQTMLYEQGKLPKGYDIFPSNTTDEILKAVKTEVGKLPTIEAENKVPVDEETVRESIAQRRRLAEVNEAGMPHPNTEIRDVDRQWLKEMMDDTIRANRLGITQKGEDDVAWFIWGAPGIGKTDMVKQLAAEHNMDLVVMNLNQMGADVLLIPNRDNRTGQMMWSTPSNLPVYDSTNPNAEELQKEKNFPIREGVQKRGGILFFDEVTRAHQSNVAAALSLIQDRAILGTWKLASEWVVFGAGNREDDDVTDYTGESAALWNRFLHVNLVLKPEEWEEYASSYKRPDVITGEPVNVIDPALPEFLKFNRELFHKFDKMSDNIEVWPSPRTWTKGSQAVWQKEQVRKSQGKPPLTMDEIEMIMTAAVGRTPARMYIGFLKLVKSINPKDLKYIWTDQKKAPLPPKEESKTSKGRNEYKTDSMQAIITAALMDKRGQKLKLSEAKNFMDYLIRMDNSSWAMQAIRALFDQHPYLLPDSQEILNSDDPDYNPEIAAITDYLADTFAERYPEIFQEYEVAPPKK